MKLLVNGSSSAGNSYVFTASDGRMLLLECGLGEKDIKRSIGYEVSKVDCVVVSHRHGDHAKSLEDVLRWGVRVVGPPDIFASTKSVFATPIAPKHGIRIGRWGIFPLPLMHDVPCYGYVISHPEMGKTLFITDSVYTEYRIDGLSHIMIECNYDDESLQWAIDNGICEAVEQSRLKTSHMELQSTLEILRATDLSQVNEIVLVHTSARNSNPQRYTDIITREFGIAAHIAKKGLELDFDKEPF